MWLSVVVHDFAYFLKVIVYVNFLIRRTIPIALGRKRPIFAASGLAHLISGTSVLILYTFAQNDFLHVEIYFILFISVNIDR